MRPGYQLKKLTDAARVVAAGPRMRERERWDRERLEQHQRRALRGLLDHARSASPFYRERLAGLPAGADVPLEELPTLDKTTLMERWDDVVTDRRLRLAEVREHVERLRRDEHYLGRYRVCATGGSSGEKGIFVWDRREWIAALSAVVRWNEWMGVELNPVRRQRVAVVAAASPIHQTYRLGVSLDVGLTKLLRLEATAPLEQLVERLNAFQPASLNAYPSLASLLALEQLDGGLRIAPRTVCTTSEVRTEEMERNIRTAWGVEPFNCYGLTEIGIFGSDDGCHRGIHAFEDLFILEVLDERGQPAPPGATGHRVLLTNLCNRTLPLIRYEVSDLLTLAEEPCPCGRPFRLVRAVEGRSDDILELADPGGRPVRVHPLHLRSPMAALDEVRQYQFVLERDGLHVAVALRRGVEPGPAAARVRAALRAKLEGLGVEVPLHVEIVDRLERDAATAAKFKLVRSNL